MNEQGLADADAEIGRIRLACSGCDRADCDFICPAQLEECIRRGWLDVIECQSYEDAIRTYPGRELEPPGYSVMDWFTHIGICPECAEEDS